MILDIMGIVRSIFGIPWEREVLHTLAAGVARTSEAEGKILPVTRYKLSRAAVAAQLAMPRDHGLTMDPWVIVTQGSFNAGTPGEAHDGGGAVDIRSRHLTRAQREVLIAALVREDFGVHDLGDTDAPHIHLLAPWEPRRTAAVATQYATSRHGSGPQR